MITLLNGEQWEEQDILKKMDDDSFYYGHLGQHALSSSSLKKLLDGPDVYKASLTKKDTAPQLREGRLIHMCILERHKVKDLIITEGTKARKEFKEATKEYGEEMVYTESELYAAMTTANALESNEVAQFEMEGMDFEVPVIGEVLGLPFRGKADVISKDRKRIIDVKTTSSSPKDFRWSAKNFKYALQAALYLELFNAESFTFITVTKGTGQVGIFPCSQEFIEQGQMMIEEAVSTYREYIDQPNSDQLLKNYVYRELL